MKKVLKSLALTGSMLAIAATAQAANTVQVTLTSPAITKVGCERVGSFTATFDQGTTLKEGDWFYMDLPSNTSICTTIDYIIADGRTPGAVADTITFPATPAAGETNATLAGGIVALTQASNGIAANTSGPAAASATTIAGPFTATAEAGVVTTGGLVLRVYAPAGGRRVWVYVYGTDLVAGNDTLTIANVTNAKLTLKLVDGQRYTGSVVLNKNGGAAWGDSTTDDIGLTGGVEYATVHNVPNVEDTLCVNASAMAGDLMFTSFSSLNNFLTFTGDSQLAHVATTSALTLESCLAGSGKGALAKTLKGNIPIPGDQASGCAFDYETPQPNPFGYCTTDTQNPFSGNRMILKADGLTTIGDPGDRYDMTLTVGSTAPGGGVYWGSANVGIQGYTPANYANATDCSSLGAVVAATFVSNATGFGDDSCTVAIGNRSTVLTTNTTGAITGIDSFNSLVVDMPTLVYDKSIISNAIETSVTVALSKYPCGASTSFSRTIGTFVTTCPSAAVAGSTTLLYPFLPPMDGSIANWWGGFTIVNASSAAGTCSLRFQDAENDVATYTTPSIAAGGQWNGGAMATLLAGLTTVSGNVGNANVSIVATCNFDMGGGFAMAGNGDEGVGYTAYVLGSGIWH